MQAKYSDTTQTISLHLYQSFHRNVCTTDKIGFENVTLALALCTQQKQTKIATYDKYNDKTWKQRPISTNGMSTQ